MNRKIQWQGKDVPLAGSYDVIIVGGGSAGCSAGLTAARTGCRTLIVERYGNLGGSAVNACVTPMMVSYTGHHSNFYEVEERLQRDAATRDHCDWNQRWFSPQSLSCAWEDLYTEAGGTLLFDACAVDVIFDADGKGEEDRRKIMGPEASRHMQENAAPEASWQMQGNAGPEASRQMQGNAAPEAFRHIRYLLVMTVEGLMALEGKVFLDATGDAVLSRIAGAPTRHGDAQGHNQMSSLRFEVGGVDIEALRAYVHSLPDTYSRHWDEGDYFESAMVGGKNFALQPLFDKAVEDGVLEPGDLRYYQNYSIAGEPGCMSFNCPHLMSLPDNTGAFDRSAAMTEGRQRIRRLMRFLKAYMPGFSNCFLLHIAPMMGVRESWEAVGAYVLTEQDYGNRARFADAVARGDWFIDVHSAGKDVNTQKYERGEYYEIPYRSLIYKDFPNLLVAGRCISATFLMQASVRIIPTVIDIGQAAGLAAAEAVRSGSEPNRLDGHLLREKLGAYRTD